MSKENLEQPDSNLEFLRESSWEEALQIWQKNEVKLEHWIKYWQEKGFKSWEEFRRKTIARMNLKTRKWNLFSVRNPIVTIPQFFGGPFKGWVKKYYQGRNFVTIADIVKFQGVKDHPIFQEIRDNFPAETKFLGLKTESGVVVVEGMHRCLAVGLATSEGKLINTKATIALADTTDQEFKEIMDSVYKEYDIPRS